MDKILFSSNKMDWTTPQDFFEKLNQEFNFDLDPCADEFNHKCNKFFTKEINGLNQNWGDTMYFVILHMVEKYMIG